MHMYTNLVWTLCVDVCNCKTHPRRSGLEDDLGAELEEELGDGVDLLDDAGPRYSHYV